MCLEPLMVEGLLSCKPLFRLCDKLLNEVFRLLGDVQPFISIKIILALLDRSENRLVVLPIERRVATKQNIEDASSGPQVTALVVVPSEHLWRDIVRSSRPCLQLLDLAGVLTVADLRKAEVDNLDA